MDIIDFVEFKTWINNKYIKWRNEQPPGSDSITAFSRMIGLDRSTVNSWIRDGFSPSAASLPKLAAVFPDIYSVINGPSGESRRAFSLLSPDEQKEFVNNISIAINTASSQGIDPKSPEGVDMLKKVFERFGL